MKTEFINFSIGQFIELLKEGLKTLLREIFEEVLDERLSTIAERNISEKPINTKEAMEHLGMKKGRFYRHLNQGLLPQRGVGDSVYYFRTELNKVLELTNNFKNQKLVS